MSTSDDLRVLMANIPCLLIELFIRFPLYSLARCWTRWANGIHCQVSPTLSTSRQYASVIKPIERNITINANEPSISLHMCDVQHLDTTFKSIYLSWSLPRRRRRTRNLLDSVSSIKSVDWNLIEHCHSLIASNLILHPDGRRTIEAREEKHARVFSRMVINIRRTKRWKESLGLFEQPSPICELLEVTSFFTINS